MINDTTAMSAMSHQLIGGRRSSVVNQFIAPHTSTNASARGFDSRVSASVHYPCPCFRISSATRTTWTISATE